METVKRTALSELHALCIQSNSVTQTWLSNKGHSLQGEERREGSRPGPWARQGGPGAGDPRSSPGTAREGRVQQPTAARRGAWRRCAVDGCERRRARPRLPPALLTPACLHGVLAPSAGFAIEAGTAYYLRASVKVRGAATARPLPPPSLQHGRASERSTPPRSGQERSRAQLPRSPSRATAASGARAHRPTSGALHRPAPPQCALAGALAHRPAASPPWPPQGALAAASVQAALGSSDGATMYSEAKLKAEQLASAAVARDVVGPGGDGEAEDWVVLEATLRPDESRRHVHLHLT